MAILFTAANAEHIEDQDSSHLNVGTSSFTFMIWAKWTEGAADQCLGGKGDIGPGGIRWQILSRSAGDFVQAEVDDNVTKVNATGTTVMNDGVLRHIAIVLDTVGETLKIYVNGVEEGSFDYSATGLGTLTNNTDFKIGVEGTSNAKPFDGTSEDCRLYLRALSSSEILSIANSQGHDVIVLGLEGRWTMNERHSGAGVLGPPPSVFDVSGKSFNLEAHGDGGSLPEYAKSELSFVQRFMRH